MKRRVIFMMLVSSILILFALLQYEFSKIPASKTEKKENKVKTILYWTPMWGHRDFLLGLESAKFKTCPQENCYATDNKTYMAVDEFDAILFHAYEYTEEKFGKPSRRSSRQVYVFGITEPPTLTPKRIKNYKDLYNWTMTYRIDSDIQRRYGSVQRKNTKYKPPSIAEIDARPKKIAWFVSRCNASSKRGDIVEELSKYIPVDIYGKCGNLTCKPRGSEKCNKLLQKNYKFYLAFENSVCEDYVTEKSYYMLQKNIVPIVYGGADYDKQVPPNSVINVMKYKSVKELAEYIQYLDDNTEEYLKYFEWKKSFVQPGVTRTLCSLCKKLNEKIVPKTYSDVDLWWRGENGNKCSTGFAREFVQS